MESQQGLKPSMNNVQTISDDVRPTRNRKPIFQAEDQLVGFDHKSSKGRLGPQESRKLQKDWNK